MRLVVMTAALGMIGAGAWLLGLASQSGSVAVGVSAAAVIVVSWGVLHLVASLGEQG